MALIISLESTTLSQFISCLPATTDSTSTKATKRQNKVIPSPQHSSLSVVCPAQPASPLLPPALITPNGLKFLKHARLVLKILVLQARILFCLKDSLLCSQTPSPIPSFRTCTRTMLVLLLLCLWVWTRHPGLVKQDLRLVDCGIDSGTAWCLTKATLRQFRDYL